MDDLETYSPATGLEADAADGRDLMYRDAFGGADLPTQAEREAGFNVYTELGIPLPKKDQGSSLSCVAQACAEALRVAYFRLTGKLVDFTPAFIYPQIAQPGGGAAIRDGMKLAATLGCDLEDFMPSMPAGQPPTEQYMADKARITAAALARALGFDKHGYRMIEAGDGSIHWHAHAIKHGFGVVTGYRGTNAGWCTTGVRPPQPNEPRWQHCVFLGAMGNLDVDTPFVPRGTFCVYTPNSWGGRYTIQSGRFKGMQAIPASYYDAGEMTAAGFVTGIHVFNGWAFVPDAAVPDNQRLMDLIKRSEGKIIQLTEAGVPGSGSMALVADGRVLEISPERAGQAALTILLREGRGVPVDKATWDALEKKPF